MSYQRVTLTGHGKGLLIYPDGYTGQVENIVWTEITAIPAGCIFLPATGYRSGSTIEMIETYGRYWSSSTTNDYYACFLYFNDNDVTPTNLGARYYGRSVRLFSEL